MKTGREQLLHEWEEHQRSQEQKRALRRPRGQGGALPLGAVAERRVAAGDAHRVQLHGAELLVTGGGDEAGAGGCAGLSIMYP